MADLERRRLVGGPLRLRDPDRARRVEVWTRRSTPASSASSNTIRAPRRLVVEDRLAVGGAQRGAPGDVEDAIDALHRPPHRAAVGDVAGRPLELELVEMVEPRAAPGEQPQLVAALGERANQVRAEEAAAAGDQGLAHRAGSHRAQDCSRLLATDRDPARHTAVVTDTTAYLPDELVAEHGIHRVSLYVTLDGEQRRESEIPADDYDDFFERLRAQRPRARPPRSPRSATSPRSTSRCSPTGREIVSIHISAGISGTYDSAQPGAPALIDEGAGGERIHVCDSRTGCGGQGMMALVAARAAAAGASRRRGAARSSGGPRDAEDVVRDRHARVPAQGRADRRRRRPGSARRFRSSRSSPSRRRSPRSSASAPGGGRSSAWSSSRASARPTAPAPGSSSTSTTPTPPARLVERVPPDLRLRPGLRLRDRPGDRRPHRPRPARLRRARRTSCSR